MPRPIAPLLLRESKRLQQAENSSRLAWSFGVATSNGWGESKIGDPLMFDAPFIDRPYVSHSYFVDDDDIIATRFPRAFGGVYRWVVEETLYVGAHVFVVVETQSPFIPTDVPKDPGYNIEHHFTFAGIGIKSIPAHLLDDD